MNNNAHFYRLRAGQSGFSLIVSLLMLVVIAILGVGAANMALNEERSGRNDRNRQIAFQAAEAALRDAEQEILTATPLNVACGEANQFRGRTTDICFDGQSGIGFADGCAATNQDRGLCETSTSTTPIWNSIDFYDLSNSSPTVPYGSFTGATYPLAGGSQPAILPRYIIERVPKNNVVGGSVTSGNIMYRITAIGFGPGQANTVPATQVVLQTIVNTLD